MPDWSAIKAEYITTEIGYRALAKSCGVSLCTLQEKGKREEWPRLRKEHQADILARTVQKTAARVSTVNANRLEKLQQAADSIATVIANIFDDEDQFRRHLVQTEKFGYKDTECRVELKVDTKSIKDLTGAMKDLTYVLRNVYDIPTMQERAAMDNAAERLRLEQQKANTGMVEDGECGVVEIAPVVQEATDE